MGYPPPDLPQPEPDPFGPHGLGEDGPGAIAKAIIVGLIVLGVSMAMAAIFLP